MAGPRELQHCSWDELRGIVHDLAGKMSKKYDCILGIANGGIIPARLLAEELAINCIMLVPVRNKQVVSEELPLVQKGKKYLIVDDIYDTGDTYLKVKQALEGFDCDYAFCMSRYHQEFGMYGRLLGHEKWVVFPWEKS